MDRTSTAELPQNIGQRVRVRGWVNALRDRSVQLIVLRNEPLVVILQSEGITIELTGHTDIKLDITYSHFETVPDAPISSFELKLLQGPHSVLTAILPAKAHGSLCSSRLIMPTTISTQDGAQIKQSTKMAVTGGPKHKKKHKHAHNNRRHRGRRDKK